ncbi:MAG TPA: hypothetical protein VJ965_05370, partial [Anaerolineales bacterium]|nr:hypothetical protein [Anaerolineales bacterium]
MKKRTVLFTLFAVFVLLLSACGGADDAANDNMADNNAADNNAADNDMADNDAAADDDMADDDAEDTYMGMTLEELASDPGYVVVGPGEAVRIGASAALTGPIPEYGL